MNGTSLESPCLSVDLGLPRAHMSDMDKPKANKTRKASSSKLMYRGNVLPRLTVEPRLPLAEIERAVAAAFAKTLPAVADD